MRLVRILLALPLALALGACSDDDDKPTPDTGVQDQGVDQVTISDGAADGAGSDGVLPDASQPDVAVDSGLMPSAWTEVLGGTYAPLNDIWGASPDSLYAVGKQGLIMLYDGSAWKVMNNSDKTDLFGVWGNGSYVYAGGDTMIRYFEGSKWDEAYEYTSTYSPLSIRDLWAAEKSTYMWGVGDAYYIRYQDKADTAPTDSWTSVSLSTVIDDRAMGGIWGTSDSEIYAVGEEGLIIRCTSSCTSSSNWNAMASGTKMHLKDIWGFASDDIYAVGFHGTILHYNGTKWSPMTVNTETYFQSVWGSGPNDIYAVGHPLFKADESIYHYDGSSWTKMPPPRTSSLNAVWGTSKDNVYAVGNFNILHYDGTKTP